MQQEQGARWGVFPCGDTARRARTDKEKELAWLQPNKLKYIL